MMVAGFSGAMLASCADDVENLYDPSYAAKKATYEAQWKQQFGEIDPNQDWGFGASSSNAEAVVTRGHYANANQYGDYYEVPAPLTDEQKTLVTKWFESHSNPQGITINWVDFFAQQVSSSEYGETMDQLVVGDAAEHILDFNAGDYSNGESVDVSNGETTYKDQIMCMKNVPTSRFGYKSSVDDKEAYYYNFVIIPGETIDESLAGMYFLGLDYEAHGQTVDQQVEADGYYNDWIVKVTPAIYKKSDRIICEDLGAIGDFDFNDIVFDAYIDWRWDQDLQQSVSEAVITVRAAGGTLPIYIGDKEVHEALGVAADKMVNTGAVDGVSAPIASFRVAVSDANGDGSVNVADITVKVVNGEATYLLEAPQGDAPQKICVPATFKWCTERTSIKDAYPSFQDWTQDVNSNKDWYNSFVAGNVM